MKFQTTITLTEAQWNALMKIMRNWSQAKTLTLGESISLILQSGIEEETKKQKQLGL